MDSSEIAKEVRKEFDAKRVDPLLLQKLYGEYNDIPNLEYFIAQAIEQFPLLGCGVASVYLKYIFGTGEIVQGKYHGHDHTFLLLNGNVVVDITADQYDGPKVYAGVLTEPWTRK